MTAVDIAYTEDGPAGAPVVGLSHVDAAGGTR